MEMERRADVKSDCTEENKGVKMRGGDRGWRGRRGGKEREQTTNSGKRSEDICTINNQIPAATLVQPLCLSLRPALHPCLYSLHPGSFPLRLPP